MQLEGLFRNKPLRIKVSLLGALSGGVAIVLIAIFVMILEKAEIRHNAAVELKMRAAILADTASAALTFTDDRAAAKTLSLLHNDPDMEEGAIYDAQGNLFASYDLSAHSAPPQKPRPIGATFDGGRLYVAEPIRLRGNWLGTIVLSRNMAALEERLSRFMEIICLVLAGAYGVSAMLMARLQASITRPLAELSDLARRVSAEKDYSVRASGHSKDEVGVLVKSFNEMLSQIGARDEALRESEERFALAARGANDGLWDWKASTQLLYLSARGNQIFGFNEEEKYGTLGEFISWIHPRDRESLVTGVTRAFESGQEEWIFEHRMRHSSGRSVWVLSRGIAIKDASGAIVRVAGSVTDITAGKIADGLTGLSSRYYFIDHLESAIEAFAEGGPVFAVLFLDLDRFKLVNDSLGHAAGDELLSEVGRRLRECVQPQPGAVEQTVVARLGGDEFAVLLTDVSAGDAVTLAELALRELSLPFRLLGRQIFPGASIGIATGDSGKTPEEVLRNADTAMYHAKQAGRGRAEVYNDEMRNRAIARIEIETDLRQAIDRDQLRVFYQPQVALGNGRVYGFEALVRWQHPERGLLPPSEFISIAEETGLIIPLGKWVLATACRQMAEWQQNFDLNPQLTISVNVSYKQLQEPGFIDDVRNILAETEVVPETLHLEMTESTLMSEADQNVNTLRELKALGVGLEIDDFGTGYSSLSCLKRLPFNTVKIDRSFVRELSSREGAVEIVRAILDLAGSMNMTIVAEGVETRDQLNELNSLGCTYAQGYYFSKPVPAAAAAALLVEEEFRQGFGKIEAGIKEACEPDGPAQALRLECTEKA